MNVKSHHASGQLSKMYKTESNPRLAHRIHGIYLAYNGHTCAEIMKITGAGRRTIQQWVEKYNDGGIEELKDKPRPGQPTKLPRDMEEKFRQRIASGPSKQDGVYVLNGPAIKRLLEREFGVVYSLWGVYDLLDRLGYSCLCSRPQHEKADPKARQELKKLPKRLDEVQSRHPDKKIEVWFQDEARFGRQGTITRIWALCGSRPRAYADYDDLRCAAIEARQKSRP